METGIHNTSEIGRLRKVMLHRPGQELENLMPEYLERLLFDLSGENDAEIRMYMDALGSAGRYQVSDNIKAKLDDAFWGGCCSEEETEETIRRYWQDHNYLIDPHTAVAAEVLAQYRVASGDETPAVVVSTAIAMSGRRV